MNLILIAAVSENNVIGNNGTIPWRIKGDMKHFRDLTIGHPVIMGRTTYESLDPKFRPLPQRKNIVLSRDFQSDEGIYIARTIEEALELAENQDLYVIGGSMVYGEFLPLANRIELTRIHREYTGDTFFPIVDWNEWNLTNQERNANKEGIEYSFLSYRRK